MSYKYVDMVCDLEQLSDIQFRLLIHIARHADKCGENAFPSIATLATAMGCSERHVQRIIKEVEELHLIKRSNAQGGRGKPTTYTLTFPKDLVAYHDKKHMRKPRPIIGDGQDKVFENHWDQLD